MSLNVLKDFPYATRHYLTHPWKFFHDCGINLKNAWHRITKGYAYTDLWNMDYWFCEIMPRMLRELADKAVGYPGEGTEWDTPEKWHDWLYSLADILDLQNEEDDARNEYAKQFHKLAAVSRMPNSKDGTTQYTFNIEDYETVRDLYFKRQIELNQEREESMRDAMNEFAKGMAQRVFWD